MSRSSKILKILNEELEIKGDEVYCLDLYKKIKIEEKDWKKYKSLEVFQKEVEDDLGGKVRLLSPDKKTTLLMFNRSILGIFKSDNKKGVRCNAE